MSRVKILSEEVSNRIAAGEVIERPASVVKELVENSLDAGADEITVIIENGGKKLIKVIDNGIGMSEDDALTAFERHATSKIRTVSDIFSISTLGFRGEALPSIASVSQMTLVTREKDSEVATQVDFKGGRLTNMSKVSANPGTSIEIRNLFSNVPARKKFLKTDPVEYKHILQYIHYQSIVHFQTGFIFIVNGKEKLNYPVAGNQDERIRLVLGKKFFSSNRMSIDESRGGMRLHGYISGLEEPEAIYDQHYIFVNGRYIKDRIISHSINSAYDPFIKKFRMFHHGKLPPYILFLEIDPASVDYNVHPAKLEIRFRDSGTVHQFIKTVLSNKLLSYEEAKYSEIKRKLQSTAAQEDGIRDFESRIYNRKTDKRRYEEVRKDLQDVYQPDIFKGERREDEELLQQMHDDSIMRNRRDMLPQEEEIVNPWQLHQSYIFVATEDGVLVIDQHAAHERVVYEKLIQRLHGAPAQSQKLLFPIVVELPPFMQLTVPQLIESNLAEFEKVGFVIKTFSNNSIVIDEIPVELENWDGGEIFLDILRNLEDELNETEDFRDGMAKSVACKSAIKAGRKMSRKEMLALINDLFACEVPFFCPHGRPAIIKLTLTEFEKRFKRIET
ncbi:MAG: DNA mismatch repair endonuclease MutL [Candidatus Stygibacter australis]|nr:DNA mismatch repair endonuclease MutL [Candidatus Stygibacter australis]MDP8322515.1 DNA mismatch repair endonuclease MutL [Candidatus Stygibacter australis]